MTEPGDGNGLLWFRNMADYYDATLNAQTLEIS